MEYKKKTIIWEDNNEPPKNYIWAKKDGKFYEYDYNVRDWVESTSISGGSGGSGGDVSSDNIVPAIIYILLDEDSQELTVHSIEESLADSIDEDLQTDYFDFKLMGYKQPPAECTISDSFNVEN